jgi:hypothetical protein
MIQLILFLLVGLLLLISLFSLARRSPRAEGAGEVLAEARQALNALQMGLLPPELVGRIFAKDDLEYVISATPKRVQEMFFRERKRVALSWVRRLSFRSEMGLALDFVALLLACRALQIFLYLRGPYAAPRMIGMTMSTASRVCEISEKSLAFLNPAHSSQFADRSADSAAL